MYNLKKDNLNKNYNNLNDYNKYDILKKDNDLNLEKYNNEYKIIDDYVTWKPDYGYKNQDDYINSKLNIMHPEDILNHLLSRISIEKLIELIGIDKVNKLLREIKLKKIKIVNV